jgi:hypothetical protein
MMEVWFLIGVNLTLIIVGLIWFIWPTIKLVVWGHE